MSESRDIQRLRKEYASRKQRTDDAELYSIFNPAQLFMLQDRERKLLACLREYGLSSLSGQSVLEVGCGRGGALKEYLRYGVLGKDLHGVDLLLDRLQEAHQVLPDLPLVNANGEALPYSNQSFDIIFQYTAFSSILDEQVKCNMAEEMLRVLKPNGKIIWYDFWLNPSNKQTKGIRSGEIKALFPDCKYDFYKITLAPPIARRIVHISWSLAHLLQRIKMLNSHYLVIIHKPIR